MGRKGGRELPHPGECGSVGFKNYSLLPLACKRSVFSPCDRLYT
ncbi:hypothetical protein PS874_06382 [Pseudomonas fluorescens]|nr:hypothetical protein PS874_06382 [Pseudomonas fluorescens]